MIQLLSSSNLKSIAEVIRQSFFTVANDFSLTTENCPGHPSFIQPNEIELMLKKGILFFGYFDKSELVGLIAIEQPDKSFPFWYIEKVSVLPNHRHKGIGEKLVSFAIDEIEKRRGTYISIALINEQTILKDWYRKLGFSEFMVKSFPHLPFNVSFMEFPLFQIENTTGSSEELKCLINELDGDLKTRYGNAEIHGIDLEKADQKGVLFYLGRYGKSAVCCGALRPFSSTEIEVKRMYVMKEFRGKGFSKQLYYFLEKQALKMGYHRMILETGKKQHEAHGLYKSVGFTPIEKYGEYINDPNSLCFSKTL